MRIVTLYLMGLLQGISFTIIPGASSFLTSEKGFFLTEDQYGKLFIPMILSAIVFSFFGGAVARGWGIRRVSISSCFINALSMALFALSALFMKEGYGLLLFTLFLIGSGFGANISTLNSYVLEFFPKRASGALAALHATLGIGTALGPLLFVLFQTHFFWWLAPCVLAFFYLLLALFSKVFFPKELHLPKPKSIQLKKGVWLFAIIAFFYGIIETAFGNWGILYLENIRLISIQTATFALSIFWGSVTLGRLVVAFISPWVDPRWIYKIIGVVLIGALLVLQFTNDPLSSFVLAGLGCSAFLPLTVSFAQKQDLAHAEFISGLIIALYMSGYGISAYGIALIPLQHLSLWLFIPASVVLVFSELCFRNERR